MPVTIKPAGHGANSISQDHQRPVKDSFDMLKRACPFESGACHDILQSSFGPGTHAATDIEPSSNGFVRGAILAYSNHHHLRIRPEDVWFAILSQLSFHINAHAEKLRGQFVSHQGKKELELVYGKESRYTVDYGLFARQISELIEENVVDPEIRSWMMPAFSTTTDDDIVIACILLMGATQKYFTFKCRTSCGLPSVTLLGDRADWELILTRIEKLKEYGEEPTQFYNLLKPVMLRFVKSFNNPSSDEIVGFWNSIAQHDKGSGRDHYSGWITAFCFWNPQGQLLYRPTTSGSWGCGRLPVLKLDDAVYHIVHSADVPPGYTSVPVKMDDGGDNFEATMVAGSVGMGYSHSRGGGSSLNTIQPESGWWMFQRKD